MQDLVESAGISLQSDGGLQSTGRLALRIGTFRALAVASVFICLCGVSPLAMAQETQKASTPPSAGQRVLAQLKGLVGSWRGTIMETPIEFTIRPTSSGTTLLYEMHTEGGGPPNHEITMFYLEGDRLLAMHYCDAGNRSRLEGKLSPDSRTIEFTFIDVAGSTRGGYLKAMSFTAIDGNRHTVEATFVMPDGKPIQLRGELQRSK